MISFVWFSTIFPRFVENFYYSPGQEYDGIIFTWVLSAIVFLFLLHSIKYRSGKENYKKELRYILESILIIGIGTFSSMLTITLVT